MDITQKKIVRFGGGGLLLTGGGWLADKTSSYAWEGILNLLTAGMGEVVTWETFPWRNAVGVISIIAGIVVIAWPWLRRLSGRITLNEDRVLSLIDGKLEALPSPDYSAQSLELENTEKRLSAEITKLIAIQKTTIENVHSLDEKLTHQKKILSDSDSRFAPIWKEHCRTRAVGIHNLLKGLLEQNPAEVKGRHMKPLGLETGLKEQILYLGIDAERRGKVHAETIAEAMGNSIFSHLTEEDGEKWSTPELKQRWYVENAQWNADIRLLREAGLIG